MTMLIIFKTRTQTLKCVNFLRSSGYTATVTDTPLHLYGSCAISVKCDRNAFMYFYRNAHSFSAFIGAYSCDGGKYSRIF